MTISLLRRNVWFLLLLVSFSANFASADERQDAVNMVTAAVEFQTKNGAKKVLAELNRPDGTFVKGELYVFAYNLLGVIVAHPINPKLVGKNLYEVPDANGKLFRREIVEGAKKQGSGWVDYVYKVPGTTRTEAKTTYYKLGGDIIFCAGVYQ